MLLWNGAHAILPTADLLASRIRGLSPQCVICNDGREDHLHLFRDCPSAAAIWSRFFQQPYFLDPASFYNSNWEEWLFYNCHISSVWASAFAIICWHIWCARNRAVFEKAVTHHRNLFHKILYDINSNKLAFKLGDLQDKGALAVIYWKPPQEGFIKLNLDGAFKDNSQTAAGGGVLRSATGLWLLGFYSKFHASSAAAAELISLRDGLSMAWKQHVTKLEVEVDAAAILEILQDPSAPMHHELGAIILDITELLKKSWVVELKHTHRDANTVAHTLAQMAFTREENEGSFHTPPTAALKAYETDLLGVNM